MKEFDYLSIYNFVILPLILTASYFLDNEKGETLRWNIVFWSIALLGGSLIGKWLAERDNEQDLDEIISQVLNERRND